MNTTTDCPRVYVACLASYNAGTLHGEWIEADENMHDAIGRMIHASPTSGAEEYAIHDHEGWGGLDPANLPIESLPRWSELIEEHGDAFAAYAMNVGEDDPDDAMSGFEDEYAGTYDSERDYAEEYIESTGQLDGWGALAHYFDYDAFASDLFMDGVYSLPADGGGIHVFHNA